MDRVRPTPSANLLWSLFSKIFFCALVLFSRKRSHFERQSFSGLLLTCIPWNTYLKLQMFTVYVFAVLILLC